MLCYICTKRIKVLLSFRYELKARDEPTLKDILKKEEGKKKKKQAKLEVAKKKKSTCILAKLA